LDIKGLNRQLRRRLERIAALRRIDTAITASLDLRHTLDVCLEQARAQLRVDAADILVCCPHTHDLTYAAGKGFRTPGVHQTRLRLACRGVGQVILERRPLHIADLGQSSEIFDRAPLFAAEGFVAYHAIPLVAKGQVRGVLEVFHRAPLDPDPEWLDFLETVASQVAIAIDNATLFEDLQRSHTALVLAYDATIEGWASALDLRDKETEGHTRRVTEMTLRLAQAMGVDPAEQAHMRRGALLHDVGKLGIPDAILPKPGKLTEEEWQVMRRHPEHAYNWLAPIAFLRPALDIPYGHHEKWDGTGYPRGLKGEQIPKAARIFAAVDIWDALCSDRPYRKGWPEERVREHLHSLAGTHLEPAVVEVFLEALAADAAGEPDGGPRQFADGTGFDPSGVANAPRPVAVKALEGRPAEQLRRADESNRQWEARRVELERDHARLVEQATTDDLTGLKNRRYFHEALEAAFSFALRQEQPLSVALLDVDDFEPYKEALGHAAGDDLLSAVALILSEHVRAHDVVARNGGDEFAILLPAADADAARAVVERLRAAIAERGWPHRPVTASVGMATMPPFILSALDLVERADRALSHAKRRGHSQVTHYDEDEVASGTRGQLAPRP